MDVKDIPGYEGKYKIDINGNVYSLPRPRSIFKQPKLLKAQPTIWGYKQVTLSGGKRFRVHQLVAITFLSKKPTPKHQVDHIDGNKSNNNVSNLRWLTLQENLKSAKDMGLLNPPIGERCAQSKLTESSVREIKHLQGNISSIKVARMYGVSSTAVLNIWRGKAWKHIGGSLCLDKI